MHMELEARGQSLRWRGVRRLVSQQHCDWVIWERIKLGTCTLHCLHNLT